MRNEKIKRTIKNNPVHIARLLGFTRLRELHNEWLKSMLYDEDDKTLQAHRGSYKTTCVSVALMLLVILRPNKRIVFIRKTDGDVKEIIDQVSKMLRTEVVFKMVKAIYGVNLVITIQNATQISTNLSDDPRGGAQLNGMGIGGSITGKHYDYIFTDDIVNVRDRVSKADRDRTKIFYQELQNIKNKGGRIYNTGTPWHKDDAFSIMPEPVQYDCYHTGIMTDQEIDECRAKMLPSLFAVNYELRHIASEDVIFTEPKTGADKAMVEQGIMQLDSAFYGSDYTAWTVMKRHDDKYYVYGKMRRKHVEECYELIKNDYDRFMCGKLYNENNADKGMVGKELRKLNIKVSLYHENMNKHMKIVTYLKAIWKDVIFVEGTDKEYIDQICDYFEDAEHDDAPDSAASLARILYKKKETEYKPLWN